MGQPFRKGGAGEMAQPLGVGSLTPFPEGLTPFDLKGHLRTSGSHKRTHRHKNNLKRKEKDKWNLSIGETM